MEPLTFDSHDTGEVEAFVSAMYSTMHVGATGPRTRTTITRQLLSPRVAFDDFHNDFDLGFDAQPQEHLVVCDVVSEAVSHHGEDGRDDAFRAGDSFLVSRPDLPYSGVVHGARLRQLTIDPALLSEVAASAGGDGAPVRMLDHRPVSALASASLRQAVAHVRRTVLTAPGTRSDLVASTASQYLAACILDTFPNSAVAVPDPGDRRDASPTTVQRAVAFIEAHPDVGLSVTDIARAAHVTPRALQLAFRRHLDTTPMAHLRDVRLELAREELKSATPGDGDTVTAVAARWGFTPSRFAQLYRESYGDLPSRALRG